MFLSRRLRIFGAHRGHAIIMSSYIAIGWPLWLAKLLIFEGLWLKKCDVCKRVSTPEGSRRLLSHPRKLRVVFMKGLVLELDC
jgi:hypothetical protein